MYFPYVSRDRTAGGIQDFFPRCKVYITGKWCVYMFFALMRRTVQLMGSQIKVVKNHKYTFYIPVYNCGSSSTLIPRATIAAGRLTICGQKI